MMPNHFASTSNVNNGSNEIISDSQDQIHLSKNSR